MDNEQKQEPDYLVVAKGIANNIIKVRLYPENDTAMANWIASAQLNATIAVAERLDAIIEMGRTPGAIENIDITIAGDPPNKKLQEYIRDALRNMGE
jgi:hypothetical protein